MYLMERSDGAVKIGWTSRDPYERRYQVSAESRPLEVDVVGCFPAGYEVERELHEMFSDYRLTPRGEWFADAPAIRAFFEPRIQAHEQARRAETDAIVSNILGRLRPVAS